MEKTSIYQIILGLAIFVILVTYQISIFEIKQDPLTYILIVTLLMIALSPFFKELEIFNIFKFKKESKNLIKFNKKVDIVRKSIPENKIKPIIDKYMDYPMETKSKWDVMEFVFLIENKLNELAKFNSIKIKYPSISSLSKALFNKKVIDTELYQSLIYLSHLRNSIVHNKLNEEEYFLTDKFLRKLGAISEFLVSRECKLCGRLMSSSDSCKVKKVRINEDAFSRNSEYFDDNEKCHDCGIVNQKGNIHHFGCDMERCPKCKGQLAFCDCDKKLLK